MAGINSGDALWAGIALLTVLLLVVVDGVVEARGAFNSGFWRAPLDQKLDHVARNPRHWRLMGGLWIGIVAASAGGMGGVTSALGESGQGVIAGIALAVFLVGSVAWLIGVILQTVGVDIAARGRQEAGSSPGWLEPLWSGAHWTEISFVILTNLAYAIWGVAMVNSGFPATWMGWVAIAVGSASVVIVVLVREAFPQLALLVPIVLGISLVIA